MKLLLDTCAILWLADVPEKLGANAASSIVSCRDELYVSSISAFEIGQKRRKGKLELGMPPEAWWEKVVSDKNLQGPPRHRHRRSGQHCPSSRACRPM